MSEARLRTGLDEPTLQATRDVLEEAGRDLDPDAILLSGGLDSAIAARVATGVWTPAICVVAPDGTDRPYAERVADEVGLRLRVVDVHLDELLDHVGDVARILGSFDPMRIRNAVVQYVGLRAAREAGADVVATGDGADELFAGYSYMVEMDAETRTAYRPHVAEIMAFAAEPLADDLGLEARSPFLAEPVQEHALDLPDEALVADRDGRQIGKRVLREAFADLPDEIRWREKAPLEVGAGSRALVGELADRLDDVDDRAARILEDGGVRIRGAEHLHYYRAYRRHHPPPAEVAPSADRRCPDCAGPLEAEATYCRTCGWSGDAETEATHDDPR